MAESRYGGDATDREAPAAGARERRSRAIGPPEGDGAPGELGDFTPTGRVLPVSILAIGISVLSAWVALGLLCLIGLFTTRFFFGRWRTTLVPPAGNQLGALEVLVPSGGALADRSG
jgi:hypothetical protein